MKKAVRNNKRFYRSIIIIITIALAILIYLLFYISPKGGGLVVSTPGGTGKIISLFSIYGPGRGERPYFSKPLSVAVDRERNIYVSDTGNNRIAIFDEKGGFIYAFGKRGVAIPEAGQKATWKPGSFNFPYGIDVDAESGNVFVADMLNRRIQIFDNVGRFLDWFPKQPYGGIAADIFPTDIAVKSGKVYVCNPYQIVIFDTKGKFIREFGMPGSEKGQFDRPNGIDVSDDGTIYVSDCNNLRIQAFTPEGKLKWAFGKKVGLNTKSTGREFGLPRNLAIGPDGNIYVADAFHFQIKVFTPDGKKIAAMGKQGTGAGFFNYPNGIEVDDDKIVYIADKENNRIQVVKLDGFVIEE